jgi:hypothetical protein
MPRAAGGCGPTVYQPVQALLLANPHPDPDPAAMVRKPSPVGPEASETHIHDGCEVRAAARLLILRLGAQLLATRFAKPTKRTSTA